MNKSLNDKKYTAFISHLKAAREMQGISLRELAAKLDEGNSVISKIETGARRLTVQEFVQYCDALGLDPSDVVTLLK